MQRSLCGVAAISGLAAAVVVLRRAQQSDGALGVAHARLAAIQFLPSLLVGAIVTWFVVDRLPHLLWLLPGLWQLLFGLGNLAAHRLLPGGAIVVGVLYLASGTCCLPSISVLRRRKPVSSRSSGPARGSALSTQCCSVARVLKTKCG